MNRKLKMLAFAVALLSSVGGCADMSARQRNTAVGAAVGGVAGSVQTNGDPLGTVGGAVVGGAIGSQNRR